MKKRIIFGLVLVLVALVAMESCKPDPDFKPKEEAAFDFQVPEGWPKPVYNFENNALTRQGFDLGKKLFFDGRLSRTNAISCGTCHLPKNAFAQAAHSVSHGVDDLLGTRNSPPLFNLNWHSNYFWDGGVNHLESQPISPITNPVEMDETLTAVVDKISDDAEYRAMFAAAFGDETVNTQRISKALAQFMGMLVSSNSKYDKYMRNEPGGEFTQAELKGLNIFRTKCESCHKEPLFSDFSFRNNGLAPNGYRDSGRAHITQNPEDKLKFKVPSLRNLRYTHPYMHDGRFGTIEEVLNYYASGNMHRSPTLDPALQNGIPLTAQEKEDLLSFLRTLDDESFRNNPLYQQ